MIGADHAVYAIYTKSEGSSAPFKNTMEVRKSTNSGITSGAAVQVASLTSTGYVGDLGLGFRTPSLAQVVAHPTNADQIFVAFGDKTSGSDGAGTYLAYTTNATPSLTWSTVSGAINDDATTRDQWQPALAFKPDGSQLFTSWYDRRNDPSNNLIDVFGRIGDASSRHGLGLNLLGGTGNDTLKGDAYSTVLYGGADNDSILGGAGDEYLYGNDGNDYISGGAGFDDLFGGNDDDTLFGVDGDYDQLYGEAGNDSLTGDAIDLLSS